MKKIWKLKLNLGIFFDQKHDKPRLTDLTTVIHRKRQKVRWPTENGKKRGNPREMAKIAVIRGKMAKYAVFRCSVYTLERERERERENWIELNLFICFSGCSPIQNINIFIFTLVNNIKCIQVQCSLIFVTIKKGLYNENSWVLRIVILNKQIVRRATFDNFVSNDKHFQEVFSDNILMLLYKSLKLKFIIHYIVKFAYDIW